MPYRNEEEALRSRVQNLEEELEEHAADAQENERLRLRVAELEASEAVRAPPPTGLVEAAAALDRAAELEQRGDIQEAATVLVEFASGQWPKTRADMELARQRLDGDPCPGATAVFQRRRADIFFKAWLYDVATTTVFSLLWAMVAIVAGKNAVAASPWWALLFLAAAAAASLAGACAFYTLSNAKAWRRPVWGTVVHVTPPLPRGRGSAIVRLDDKPEKDVLVTFSREDRVEAGMRALFYRRFFTGAAWLP